MKKLLTFIFLYSLSIGAAQKEEDVRASKTQEGSNYYYEFFVNNKMMMKCSVPTKTEDEKSFEGIRCWKREGDGVEQITSDQLTRQTYKAIRFIHKNLNQ